jgi:hypothetical protein
MRFNDCACRRRSTGRFFVCESASPNAQRRFLIVASLAFACGTIAYVFVNGDLLTANVQLGAPVWVLSLPCKEEPTDASDVRGVRA